MLCDTGKNFARSSRTFRKNTLQIAQDIPEAQFGFRASAHARSIGETLAHIAANPGWSLKLHRNDKVTLISFEYFTEAIAPVRAYEATLTDKAAIVAELGRGGTEFASWIEGVAGFGVREP